VLHALQHAATGAAIAQIEEVPCIGDRSADTVDGIASEPAEARDQPDLNGLSRAFQRLFLCGDTSLHKEAVIGLHPQDSPTETHTAEIVVVEVLALPRYSTRA